MRRSAWVVTVGLVVCVALAGCSGTSGAKTGATTSEGASAGSSEGNEAQVAEQYAAIPIDGAHEKAAEQAIPSALKAGLEMRKNGGLEVPDVTGIKPVFTAYLVSAVAGNTLYLFEVHADGVGHPLYDPRVPADATNILKQDASLNSGAVLADPQGTGETGAAAAAKAVTDLVLPGETVSIKILGYRFVYLKDGAPVLTLEINPEGGVISAG